MSVQGARRLAVVGAGWAGLAAAIRGAQAGAQVTLYDMAATPGGRARSVQAHGQVWDNGQHILIGAYTRTLDLMRTVGLRLDDVLARMPLALIDAQGHGLRLPGGTPRGSCVRGVWGHPQWSLAERLALVTQAGLWAVKGFRCEPDRPVAEWCRSLPERVQRDLIEPLCVAALNTPSEQASAAVFLRVLRDALFSGRGSADLLLPKRPLGELLPEAATAWLRSHGAPVMLGHRVQRIEESGGAWHIDGQAFDQVVLATPPGEAARLTSAINPAWSAQAAGFDYEPIITAWVDAPVVRTSFPMLALRGGPAQFAFDLGALGLKSGRLSLVVSGARPWVEAGSADFEAALQAQIRQQLARVLPQGHQLVQVITEKRATFRCVPALLRPPLSVAPGLAAAGDHVQGPYPATLEGAVRSGEAAIRELNAAWPLRRLSDTTETPV